MMRFFVAGAALAVLASCATLTEEQCQTVDWQDLGQRDGAAGHHQARIGDHLKACLRHDLPVNQTAYAAGWSKGIVGFCTAQNGYNHGRAGNFYAESCPADIAAPFEATYGPAKRVHDTEDALRRADAKVEDLLDQIQQVIGSEDPEAEAKLTELRSDLLTARSARQRAKHQAEDARRALDLYLRANPEIIG